MLLMAPLLPQVEGGYSDQTTCGPWEQLSPLPDKGTKYLDTSLHIPTKYLSTSLHIHTKYFDTSPL